MFLHLTLAVLLVLTHQMDRPPNCDVYSFSLGTCWSCVDGYRLEDNACVSTQLYIVQQPVTTSNYQQQTSTGSSTQYSTPVQNTQQGSTSNDYNSQSQSYYNQQVVFPWNTNNQQTTTQTTNANSQPTYTNTQQTTTSTQSTGTIGVSTNTQFVTNGNSGNTREAFTYSDMHCRKPDPLETRCNECSHYYYYDSSPDLGRCVPVSDQCNGYQDWDGKCTDCWPGYTLRNGVPGECEFDPTFNNGGSQTNTVSGSSSGSTVSSGTSGSGSTASGSGTSSTGSSGGVTVISNPTTGGSTSSSGSSSTVTPTIASTSAEPIWVVFMGYYLQINCATNQVTQAIPINLAASNSQQQQQTSVISTPVQSPVQPATQPTVQIQSPAQPQSGTDLPQCVTRQIRLSSGECWTVNGNCQDWLDDGTCVKCYLGFNVDPMDNRNCVIT